MYKLHANCLLTKGIERSIICDTQLYKFFLIPNSLYHLFDSKNIIYFSDLLSKSDEESNNVLIEYKDFLTENNLIFKIEKSEENLFPPIPMDFNFPSHITNILIDIKNTDLEWGKIIDESDALNCLYFQLRFFRNVSNNELTEILHLFGKCLVHSIDIILPHDATFFQDKTTLETIVNHFPKIRSIIFYNSGKNEIVVFPIDGLGGVKIVKSNIDSELYCGIISPSLFSKHIVHYTESLQHNTCLNRKIAIDIEGNIKNCPSMKESFGNIKNTTLQEAINKSGFKKYWNISKDKINKCKDCEFRHICTDCRAYLEDPNDIYSAPLKCGYNPYTCKWEEWSSNPLKQAAIEYYKMDEILKS